MIGNILLYNLFGIVFFNIIQCVSNITVLSLRSRKAVGRLAFVEYVQHKLYERNIYIGSGKQTIG